MNNKKCTYKIFILVIILLIAISSMVFSKSYQLHTGDRVRISVWGHDDLSTETVIGPDGYINIPLLESIKAEGKTSGELRIIISEKLAEYIRNPQLTVSLIEYHRAAVMVLGEVNSPGSYQIEGSKRVLEVLSSAGGPTQAADMQNVRLTREDKFLELDLNSVIQGENIESNHIVEDGDVIYIPRGNDEVTIGGEIRSPGSYQWYEELRLADLVARAGNVTDYGNIGEVHITHRDESKRIVNLKQFYQEGSIDANPHLKPGDSIFISRGNYRVSILGEVQSPGTYDWDEDLRLDNLLAAAGNMTDRGDIEKIKIMREDGSSEIINLNEYFENPQQGKNPVLQPGDTIQVKEKDSVNWTEIFSFVSGLNIIKDFLEINW